MVQKVASCTKLRSLNHRCVALDLGYLMHTMINEYLCMECGIVAFISSSNTKVSLIGGLGFFMTKTHNVKVITKHHHLQLDGWIIAVGKVMVIKE